MPTMRAKLQVIAVEKYEPNGEVQGERLHFRAVCKPDGYPADGADEDNTYAKFSPDASLSIYVANPALFGKFEAGQKYYVDFSLADK